MKSEKQFYIKPQDSATILNNCYNSLLDAIDGAKRICDCTKKQVFLYKLNENGEYIDMGYVTYFYSDLFYADRKNKIDIDEEDCIKNKRVKRGCDGDLPVLSKLWDEFTLL